MKCKNDSIFSSPLIKVAEIPRIATAIALESAGFSAMGAAAGLPDSRAAALQTDFLCLHLP